VLLLILVAPQLARFALRFSSFEYFWLGALGLSLSALVTRGSTAKGLASAALGVFLATVGREMVTGTPRFTFGSDQLMGGLKFIPAMIGLFGLAEVFRNLPAHRSAIGEVRITFVAEWGKALRIVRQRWRMVLQSSALGTFIGALPGAGADIAAWGAYGLAQKTSPRRDNFGKGEVDGVIAPTSANNAAVGGAWIPALVFGIPGDAVTAVVLGALLMHNLKPGPRLFTDNAAQLHAVFTIAVLTQLLLIPAGYVGIRAFATIMKLPRGVIMAGVVTFSVVGAYALEQSWFDVYVMFLFGLLGLAMESMGVPVAPLILGMILGPVLEENLRVGLLKTGGSLWPFVSRPDSLVMALMLLFAFLAAPLARGLKRRKTAAI
jgi:putative tricarboxylic transport membrane protein